jgi:hypothetical protein
MAKTAEDAEATSIATAAAAARVRTKRLCGCKEGPQQGFADWASVKWACSPAREGSGGAVARDRAARGERGGDGDLVN